MPFAQGAVLSKAGIDAFRGQPYSLTVLNENSKFQQFAMFQTIPQIVGPSVNPLSLAWMLGAAAGKSTGGASSSTFFWEINYSANTGYIQDLGTSLNPRRFTTTTNMDVLLNKQNELAVTYQGAFPNGAPAFPSAPTDGTAGEIIVNADDKIPTSLQTASQSMTINVGIGMNHKPTIAVQLLPNITYQFTPKPTYYIISGSFVEGQVIDTAQSTSAYEVQFEGVTDKKLRFTEQNQFEPA